MSRAPQQPRTLASGRANIVLAMAIGFSLAVSAALAQVWTHQQAIAYGYTISQQNAIRTRLLEQQQRLRIELALLRTPARISALARTQAGLREPEPEQMRRLRLRGAPAFARGAHPRRRLQKRIPSPATGTRVASVAKPGPPISP